MGAKNKKIRAAGTGNQKKLCQNIEFYSILIKDFYNNMCFKHSY